MIIGINGNALSRGYTSPTPFRGMVRALIASRPSDHFVIAISHDEVDNVEFQTFRNSLVGENWRLHIDTTSRRVRQIMAMAGSSRYNAIRLDTDVFVNTDLDYLGPRCNPQINTVADLSSIDPLSQSSLAWHGRRMRKNAFRVLNRYSQNIVTISNDTRDALVAFSPSLQDRISVIHCGIDERWHDASDALDSSLPPVLNGEKPYWVWWGLVSERKNLRRALHAYELCVRSQDHLKIPDFLIISEPTPKCNELRSIATNLGISNHVRFLGSQPLDVLISIVQHSCGVVFPSLAEGFGLPPVEAMRLGKPVLISNRGALPEVTGGYGIECNPECTDDIARAMRDLLHESFCEKGACRRSEWAKAFSYTRAAQQYSEIIERLVS
jgi:glycosyltransferase involved in cell wall biosynthesis